MNLTFLSFTAACRIRPSALCTVARSSARFVFCRGVFPLARPLRSTCSAVGVSASFTVTPALFAGARHYYGSVRLPASVHHRRTSLDFSMRPKRAGLGGRRISRFSRKLLPCLPGVSDRAGYQRPLPRRHVGCCFPLTTTGSASRTKPFSRLNTQPTLSPVNASPNESLHSTHDSGPLWLARPLTYDSFIHYNLPVYPGALRWWLCLTELVCDLNLGLRP